MARVAKVGLSVMIPATLKAAIEREAAVSSRSQADVVVEWLGESLSAVAAVGDVERAAAEVAGRAGRRRGRVGAE